MRQENSGPPVLVCGGGRITRHDTPPGRRPRYKKAEGRASRWGRVSARAEAVQANTRCSVPTRHIRGETKPSLDGGWWYRQVVA